MLFSERSSGNECVKAQLKKGKTMIKVSDYIVKKLAKCGITHVFMITGGGAMHLNDSIGSCKEIEYVCNQHEQACAIAAEGYFRASGKLAAVNITSGPGGTNTITGVIGQWLDSIPCVYISGQVRWQTTIASCPELGLRQLGDQEINIVDIVRPVTKYAVMVQDPNKIRYHLERAVYLATNGRPGPTWLDIPLDVQAALIDENSLIEYDPSEDAPIFDTEAIRKNAAVLIDRIRSAKRPVILAGHGIRLAGGADEFLKLVGLLNIPIVTAINAHDLIYSDHPLFFGRPGIVGDRLGNLVIQNCDLLISIGARMGVRQISYNYKAFAREAYKVMVDIDPAELRKPTLSIDLPIQADARWFIQEMLSCIKGQPLTAKKEWLKWCEERRDTVPTVFEDNLTNPQYVNSYKFAKKLFDAINENSIVVTGNGSAYTGTYQVMRLKKGVRVFTNQACASMGYDLPAAIGASVSMGRKPVVLITGDGSIQMNIQELQTVVAYQLPIKIFILNNNGYLSIRMTQDSYFQGRHYGSDPSGGLFLPKLALIAHAYGIPVSCIQNDVDLDSGISQVLLSPGPQFCEVFMDPNQTLYPKLSSIMRPDGSMVSMPLEDMYPFMEREEFNKHMIIPPLDQSKKIS
jgi:acetolactate synthase I/II/III large subunit